MNRIVRHPGSPPRMPERTGSDLSMNVMAADELLQEFYDEDFLSLHTVLSWGLRKNEAGQTVLRIHFHNSFYFDSEGVSLRPERWEQILQKLKSMSRYHQPALPERSDHDF